MNDRKPEDSQGGEQIESRAEDKSLVEGFKILHTIMTAAPIGIGMVRDRVFLHVNRWFCEMTGYSREELLNHNARMIYPSEQEYERVGEEKYRQISKHGHGSVETQFACKNGNVIDVYLSSMVIDPGDISKGVVFTALDITERKQAEKLVRDAEQRFKDLAYMLPQAVFEIDMKGKVAFMNHYGLEALGFTQEDIDAGMSATDMIAPEDRERVAESIRCNLTGNFVTGNEYNAMRKDGSSVPVVTYASPIRKGDQIVGIRGLAVNITERKELEDQLRQSQKMEAVGRLAGGLAHDFNNLLTGILGYSQLALESLDRDHPARDFVETIRKTGKNASELTDRLLAFSRRKPISRRVVSVNDIVSGMDEMLTRLIGEDIRFDKVLEPDLFNVQADPNEIEHAIVNLAINSRDSMPHGGELIIETHNVVVTERSGPELVGIGPGEYVMLAVSDTGLGMSAEVKARIFEPFFTTKPDPKGTGLGMSIVYGIVTQNGGHVCIRSSPGKGTTVKVYFPRVDKPLEVSGGPVSEPKSLRGTETILVVEDQAVVRSLVTRVLSAKGYSVLEAADGEEALEVSESYEGPIHLMLTDVVMPGIGGAELAQMMAKSRPDTETIYMSGYTDDEIIRRGVIDQGRILIQKPFTREMLTLKVRTALDKAD